MFSKNTWGNVRGQVQSHVCSIVVIYLSRILLEDLPSVGGHLVTFCRFGWFGWPVFLHGSVENVGSLKPVFPWNAWLISTSFQELWEEGRWSRHVCFEIAGEELTPQNCWWKSGIEWVNLVGRQCPTLKHSILRMYYLLYRINSIIPWKFHGIKFGIKYSEL